MMNCDVFISYRRDGGDMTAMHIYQALKERGYNVFYDLEVLRAGKFNEALLEAIDSCQDFVLILSPHALDRCQEEGDWVRREIAEALKKKKNIVPILLNGFRFPESLPREIDEVRFQNGLSATTEYFSESMDRLADRYLISKPVSGKKRTGASGNASGKKQTGRKGIILGAGLGGAAVLIAVILLFVLPGKNPPPAAPIPPAATEAPVATEAPDPSSSLRAHYEELARQELPVLRPDPPADGRAEAAREMSVFGGPWMRKEISRIELTDRPFGKDAWDVSEAEDGSVMAWVEEEAGQKTLYIGANGPIRMPADMTGMFQSYSGASRLAWNGLADFSQVESATNCFSFSAFESLDFEGVPFSSLLYSDGLFQRCEQLSSLNLDGMTMDRVVRLTHMFDGCEKLEKLDLRGLDTSRAREMTGVFMYCTSLKELDLSGFTTSRVLTMNSLFEQCVNLRKVNLSGWDTSSVTDMNFMFSECQKLEELDLSGFRTSEVQDMSFMFSGCKNLLSLDVSGFDTSRVTNMDGMFLNCEQLDLLDLSRWNTASVTSMRQMFQGCPYLLSLNLSSFDTSSVTRMSFMFHGDAHLKELNVSSFRTEKVKSFEQMFAGCESLTGLDVSGFSLAAAETMAEMFRDCISLTSIGTDPGSFGSGDTTNMYLNSGLSAVPGK